jgi:hypothetical protein
VASENQETRGMSGAKNEETTGDCEHLHVKELNNLYCSSDIIRIINLRRVRWVEYLARI